MVKNMDIRPDYESRRGAEQMQQAQQARNDVVQKTQETAKEKETSKDTEKPLTREEVQGVINSLTASIKSIVIGLKNEIVTARGAAENMANKVLNDVNSRQYATEQKVRQIATDTVPVSLRGLDSDPRRKGGDILKLASNPNGDSAYWGTVKVGGLTAAGDKVLYKGIFLREYDENGVIVAAGSEINPADYATQALYEAALTTAGHTLKYTNDWMRAGLDI